MLSVRAIYDGKNIKFSEKIIIDSPREVIVTFLDESAEGNPFAFLGNPEEDIYSDYDLKVKS